MKRFLSLVLAILFVIAIVPPVASSAKKLPVDPIFPFKDVSTSKWYYAAVRECFVNGYMSGTSDKTFSPNSQVTRATFLVTLAKVSGVLLSNYSDSCPMGDVENAKWYTQSINWAIENSIAAGVGSNSFAPNNAVTREQIVLMLFSYAKSSHYDVGNIDDASLDVYADKNEIHNWGDMQTAMRWAVSHGIISGRDANTLAPQGTATRAELALMIVKFIALEVRRPGLVIKIDDVAIEKYTIIYPANGSSTEKNAANELKKYIYKTNGVIMNICDDSAAEKDREILVGKTSRIANIDYSGLGSEGFIIANDGSKLVLYGGGDRGTIYSVYEFCEKYLGWRFYTAELEVCRADSNNINVCDVYERQTPSFGYRDVHMMTYTIQDISVKRKVNGPYRRIINENLGGNIGVAGGDAYFVHNLNKYYGSSEELLNTCISTDSANIKRYMSSIEKVIGNGESDIVNISAMDSAGLWCNCPNCRALALQYPNRYDRWMLFVNEIAGQIKQKHPNIKVMTLAYLDTFDKPGSIKPADNVLLMACPITESLTSKMDSPEHKAIRSNFEVFASLCDKDNLYVWEYPKSLTNNLAPLPSIFALIDHLKFYAQIGVEGVFLEGNTRDAVILRSGRVIDWRNDGEFGELRAYLASKVLWNASIADEEIEVLIKEYMQDRYGMGWGYIYEIFQLVYRMADISGYSLDIFFASTESRITAAYTVSELLYMEELFDKAMSFATNTEQYDFYAITRTCIDSMVLNKLWYSYINSGDKGKRDYIIKVNERMYRAMVKYNIYPEDWYYSDLHKNETDFTKKTAKNLLKYGS